MKPIAFIGIELTNECNYQCAHCPHDPGNLTRERGCMDFSLFEKVVSESYELTDCVNLSFFGEPLLHPRFMDCLDLLKGRPEPVRLIINSNMSLMTRETFGKLIDCALTELRISMDAAARDTYDSIRPGSFCLNLDGEVVNKEDRFDVQCEKIEYWFSLKDHCATRHVFTVTSGNRHEIKRYVDKWKPLLNGEDQILIKSVLTYGGKISDELTGQKRCDVWDENILTVDWKGNVSPCNLDTNMELVIGTVHASSLLEIANSPEREKIRKLSLSRSISPCDRCADSNNWSKNITITNRSRSWEEQLLKMYGGEAAS